MQTEVNLNLIHCFTVLAETLSFSEAGDRLRLAQSNVSRQIKLLEESLGVRLFHRTKQGVSLTPEGVRFKAEVLPIAGVLQEKLSQFQNQQKEEIGEIRVACFSEVGQNFFMPLCLEFQRKHPKITLEMDYKKETEILEALRKSEDDFGILSHPPIIEGLGAFPLLQHKIVLVGPKHDFLPTREEIEDAPFMAFEKNDALLHEFWSKFISKRKKPRIMATVNSHRSILDGVALNGFFAVIPLMSVKGYPRPSEIQVIPDFEYELPLYLVHPNSDWAPKKNQIFKQFLLKRAKENKGSL